MSANERNDALIDELRRLRLKLTHRIKILTARRTTAPLATGLIARANAIERELMREAELSVEEVRTEATIDAIAEHLDEVRTRDGVLERQLAQLAEKTGYLRAERTRIEARLQAERSAVEKMQRLLDLRLRLAGVARDDTL